MADSVVPGIIDAYYEAAADALPDVIVYDGPGVTNELGPYLHIGVDDPDTRKDAVSAQTTETPGPFSGDRKRDENGTITFLAVAFSGDGTTSEARDEVYRIANTVAALGRATPSMGADGVLWTGYGQGTQLKAVLDPNRGVRVSLMFTISFRGRI